jgi:hypothetical protein
VVQVMGQAAVAGHVKGQVQALGSFCWVARAMVKAPKALLLPWWLGMLDSVQEAWLVQLLLLVAAWLSAPAAAAAAS